LARRLGAQVYATAGSDEKRALLTAEGVARVLDSRSLDFYEEVLAETRGEGVDVVVNTLTGAATELSLALLAEGGRFIELGKTDIHRGAVLDLNRFVGGRSYHAVDLAATIARRPEQAGRLLRRGIGLVTDGSIAPLPVTAHRLDDAPRVFSEVAQARQPSSEASFRLSSPWAKRAPIV
jgi:epothilone polyketide synthase D